MNYIYAKYPVIFALFLFFGLNVLVWSETEVKDMEVPNNSIDNNSDVRFQSVKFRDADIKEVLIGIGELYGVNIICPPDIQGKITINLSNVSLIEALDYILTTNGYIYKKRTDKAYIIEKYKPLENAPLFLIKVQNDKLTIDAVDADVKEFLTEIARKSNRNIVASSNVQGKITVRVADVAIEEGLKTILASNGFSFEKIGNIISVDKPAIKQGQQKNSFDMLSTASLLMVTPIEVKDDLVTINLDDIELMELLRVLSNKSKVNILTFGNISDRISAHISNVTFEQAIKLILIGTRYSYKKTTLKELESSFSFIKDENVNNKQIGDQQEIYLIGESSQTSPLYSLFVSTEVFELSYLKAEEASTLLSSIIPPTNVKIMKPQNALAITCIPDLLEKARLEISKIDIPPKSMIIGVVVVELFDSSTKDLGLDLAGSIEYLRGETPGNLTYQTVGGLPRSFTAALRTLIENGRANILANPEIATTNGLQATIEISQERYYRMSTTKTSQQSGSDQTAPYYYPYFDLRTIRAGVTLSLTAWAGTDGNISVNVSPQVSSMSATGPEALPEVSTRRASTTIQVKDGETIIIGGLKQKEDSKSIKKTPLLGSIPLLGRLFQSVKTTKRETELTILITPRIISSASKTALPK
jgi:type II secretory pathway component GspD/PulD (secretin)